MTKSRASVGAAAARTAGTGPAVASLYALSFASGAAALAYQVVWAKQLSLAFGGTTLAASAVVAAFMGGMGVGAWIVPRFGERAGTPLRLYGLLEIAIGLLGLALTAALWRIPEMVAGWPVAGGGLTALRFAFAFAVLLLPTAAMGATFPVLAAAIIRSAEGVSRHLGLVYGLNTVGAAAGALLTGLVLVEQWGLNGTVRFAVALNLLVGAFALAMARGAATVADQADAAQPAAAEVHTSQHDVVPSRLPAAVTAAVLVLSGFATLAYEVLWFRVLTYLFGNSTYAFTMMLFVFLVGLGVGPLFFRWASARGAEMSLAVTQLAVGAFTTLALAAAVMFVGDPEWGQHVSIFTKGVFDRPWQERLLLDFGFALLVLLPSTLAMGLSFPLASSLWLGNVRQLGRRLGGAVFLANTGSIAGSLLASLFLLPALGTIGGIQALVGLNLALGVGVLMSLRPLPRATLPLAGAVAVGAVVLFAGMPSQMQFAGSVAAIPNAELLFEQEGDLSTVQVWRDPSVPERVGMAIDGTVIGATESWPSIVWAKQVLIAHLPMVLRPDARDVLTIGLGSGSTLASLAAWPSVRSLDVVEINAPVVEGARLFRDGAALDDSRVDLHVEDAIHYLLRAEETWDLIVSDGKQAMSFSGTAKLLSREFYALARRQLRPAGLFVQWVPVAIGGEEFDIIVRTFTAEFPHVEVFFDTPTHLVFVGSAEPLVVPTPTPWPERARQELSALGIDSPSALLARWCANGEALRRANESRVNSWDRPWLEFTAYKLGPAQWSAAAAEILGALAEAGENPTPLGQQLAPRGLPAADAARYVRLSCAQLAAGDRAGALRLAQRAANVAPQDRAVQRWVARFLGR